MLKPDTVSFSWDSHINYGVSTILLAARAAVGMGIPMGMGMVWVWGLWWIPIGSVGNLWGFLNGCNFRGIETNSTNSEFVFFITFIFSCIIIVQYLYSQVIPICAKRRRKTMILSLYFNGFWPIQLRDGRTYGRTIAFIACCKCCLALKMLKARYKNDKLHQALSVNCQP